MLDLIFIVLGVALGAFIGTSLALLRVGKRRERDLAKREAYWREQARLKALAQHISDNRPPPPPPPPPPRGVRCYQPTPHNGPYKNPPGAE